jgi:hypothetical protein
MLRFLHSSGSGPLSGAVRPCLLGTTATPTGRLVSASDECGPGRKGRSPPGSCGPARLAGPYACAESIRHGRVTVVPRFGLTWRSSCVVGCLQEPSPPLRHRPHQRRGLLGDTAFSVATQGEHRGRTDAAHLVGRHCAPRGFVHISVWHRRTLCFTAHDQDANDDRRRNGGGLRGSAQRLRECL